MPSRTPAWISPRKTATAAAVIHRLGHRRPGDHRSPARAPLGKGPDKVSAFTIPEAHGQRRQAQSRSTTACTARTRSWSPPAPRDQRHRRRLQDDPARRGRLCITGGSEAALTPMGLGGFARHAGALRTRTTTRRAPAGRSTATATASSSPKGRACSSSKNTNTPRPAARTSTPNSRLRRDLRRRPHHRPRRGRRVCRPAPCKWPSTTPGSSRDVDYINAHGTSTALGDIAETTAMKTDLQGSRQARSASPAPRASSAICWARAAAWN